MQFGTRQLIERVTLALGVASVGIVMFGAIARSQGAPIVLNHIFEGDQAVAVSAAPAQLSDHQKLKSYFLDRTR